MHSYHYICRQYTVEKFSNHLIVQAERHLNLWAPIEKFSRKNLIVPKIWIPDNRFTKFLFDDNINITIKDTNDDNAVIDVGNMG